MGAIAEKLADNVILTDDNPRTEPAEQIIEDILSGMQTPTLIEHDRREAISQAVRTAKPGDIVLVAGKGHESLQTGDGFAKEFSDRTVVPEVLEELS